MRDNPFPAIHGRVCYHKCETACNRKYVDEAIGIHTIERFIGDTAIEKHWVIEPGPDTGKKILIIGAGPSGLSAAYHLRRLGHEVEIRDAAPKPGGMLRYGIPKYRLPREILNGEVARLLKMGVRIKLNHKVTDLHQEKTEGAFDAVFVAVGAHLGKRVNIPAEDASRIIDATTFLKDVEAGNPPLLGRRVAIYGGGNTAIDAARTARRLGVDEALIVYRRDRSMAPAHDEEIDDAEEEGVKIHWLRTIAGVEGGQIMVERMVLDENRRPVGTGEYETLSADAVILALGQESETEFLKSAPGVQFSDDGTVLVNEQMMTGCEGIFAGGDMVPSERSVTVAVGHGKKAARHIDAWLNGRKVEKRPKNQLASYDRLNPWYYTQAEINEQPRIDLERRRVSFDEVLGGYTYDEAVLEARRCLSCGNCYECDGCLGACPEDAVIKLGPGNRYRFNYEACIGCGACYEQCPCGAIDFVPDTCGSTLTTIRKEKV